MQDFGGGGSSIELWRSEHESPGLDSDLQERVRDELRWQGGLDASAITVGVDERVAILGGSVRTYAERRAAEQAASRVPHVRGVVNKLRVDLPSSHVRPDAQLTEEVTRVLEWDTQVPAGKVLATVADGRVTLSGEVDWDHQRIAAETAITPLMGIRAVDNRLTVRPKWATSELPTAVLEVLRRHHELHTQHVRVETVRGMVVLHGDVPSIAERFAVERLAWDAPGVLGVVNELTVH